MNNETLNEEIESLKKWVWSLSKKMEDLSFDDLTCTGTLTAQNVVATNELTIGEKSFLEKTYPVGSIYLSITKTNPETLFGGTWTLLAGGKALWTTEVAGTGGDTIAAALPNIKGTFTQLRADANSGFSCDGVLFKNSISSSSGTGGGANGKRGTITFNANAYNSIYKDAATTVQPPAIKIFAWRRIS